MAGEASGDGISNLCKSLLFSAEHDRHFPFLVGGRNYTTLQQHVFSCMPNVEGVVFVMLKNQILLTFLNTLGWGKVGDVLDPCSSRSSLSSLNAALYLTPSVSTLPSPSEF